MRIGLCRRHRGESERALHILAGRGMVEIDEVRVENVVAIGCRGVDVFVNIAGVELGVMIVADGEEDDIGSRWL